MLITFSKIEKVKSFDRLFQLVLKVGFVFDAALIQLTRNIHKDFFTSNYDVQVNFSFVSFSFSKWMTYFWKSGPNLIINDTIKIVAI